MHGVPLSSSVSALPAGHSPQVSAPPLGLRVSLPTSQARHCVLVVLVHATLSSSFALHALHGTHTSFSTKVEVGHLGWQKQARGAYYKQTLT